MAQQGVLLDQDQFCCSVCLDLLKEPVTIPCGHSYCKSCIESCWDQDDLKGIYNCPQCRQTFTPRPTLRKNNMLAEVVDKLKKTGLQAASPDLCSAGPGDVVCDFCTGTRKPKALMSCLMCLASYCESHLQPHYEVAPLKKHKLIKATTQLQEKICPHHDKLLEVFCRTDQQCICMLCVMDEHKGHDTVSAAAERTEKQKQLGISQQEVQQKVQEREKELKKLQQAVESLKDTFDLETWLDKDTVEILFSEKVNWIKKQLHDIEDGFMKELDQRLCRTRRTWIKDEKMAKSDPRSVNYSPLLLWFSYISLEEVEKGKIIHPWLTGTYRSL
ncbi:hypothetical protein DPEC_G00219510 [Dallia pectoralis]|uniref:Uncharacterized protein n=1 Tax=Dallia pectoralis TaxID=75939 RepID=A0ACC2G3F4_DALPE|nr:hypothetical protein DPEC_G00219510 [Dallia pectoralis]